MIRSHRDQLVDLFPPHRYAHHRPSLLRRLVSRWSAPLLLFGASVAVCAIGATLTLWALGALER